MLYLLYTQLKNVKNIFISINQCYGISNKSSLCLLSKFGFNMKLFYKRTPEFVRTQFEFSVDKMVVVLLKKRVGRFLRYQENFFMERLLSLRNYRALRHRQCLPVRGQRTHTNAKTCRRGQKSTPYRR